MIVLTQFSYTSAKNCRMASSVAGEVGFAAMLLALALDDRLLDEPLVMLPEGSKVEVGLLVAFGSGQ